MMQRLRSTSSTSFLCSGWFIHHKSFAQQVKHEVNVSGLVIKLFWSFQGLRLRICFLIILGLRKYSSSNITLNDHAYHFSCIPWFPSSTSWYIICTLTTSASVTQFFDTSGSFWLLCRSFYRSLWWLWSTITSETTGRIIPQRRYSKSTHRQVKTGFQSLLI